jgi:hypothetical protein
VPFAINFALFSDLRHDRRNAAARLSSHAHAQTRVGFLGQPEHAAQMKMIDSETTSTHLSGFDRSTAREMERKNNLSAYLRHFGCIPCKQCDRYDRRFIASYYISHRAHP